MPTDRPHPDLDAPLSEAEAAEVERVTGLDLDYIEQKANACGPEGHVCANHVIHAQAKIIGQRQDILALVAEVRRLRKALRITVEALKLIALERGNPVTRADDALTQLSVMDPPITVGDLVGGPSSGEAR